MKYAKMMLLLSLSCCLFSGCVQQTQGAATGQAISLSRLPSDINDGGLKEVEIQEEIPIWTMSPVEAEAVKREMLDIAMSYRELYIGMDKGTALNAVISDDGIKSIIDCIAEKGYAVTGINYTLENFYPFEDFIPAALDGREATASYYSVQSDGGFFRLDFHSMDKRLFVTTTAASWDDKNNPEINMINTREAINWRYTEKGYLIYDSGDDLWQYALYRVKPIGKTEQELYSKYIKPIGYQGNNLFLTDWDQSTISRVDLNDLYEYIYHADTGTFFNFDYNPDGIAAEDFEPLITKYFNLSSETLKSTALYYSDTNKYFWDILYCGKNYVLFPAPEPEVVDSWQNNDGTITMVVDAIDDYRGNDRAFTHEVTIQINDDGSCKYLSNHIRPEDAENVPVYYSRSAFID